MKVIKSQLNHAEFHLKNQAPKISLSEEARELNEKLLSYGTSRPKKSTVQVVQNSRSKLPVNFFLDPTTYRKNLIQKGRNIERSDIGVLAVMELQDYNESKYSDMQDARQKNIDNIGSLRSAITKSNSQTLPCNECECCCCPNYCRQCIQESCEQVSRFTNFQMGVQEEYLYQRVQKERVRVEKSKGSRCHTELMHLKAIHGDVKVQAGVRKAYEKAMQDRKDAEAGATRRRELYEIRTGKQPIYGPQLITKPWQHTQHEWNRHPKPPTKPVYQPSEQPYKPPEYKPVLTQPPERPPCHQRHKSIDNLDSKIKMYGQKAIERLSVEKERKEAEKKQVEKRKQEVQKLAKLALVKCKGIKFRPSQQDIQAAFKAQYEAAPSSRKTARNRHDR